ncbi:MAG: helix-turn-helix domain-containing protein [Nevskia sp.]|uniref:helix-turn-helix domain-containing protein n=1 Tax=Nevskia sp. TaxID=1929292 RepID=UPI0040365A33
MPEASPVTTRDTDHAAMRQPLRDPSPARHPFPLMACDTVIADDRPLLGREHPLHLVDRVVRDCIGEPAAQQLLAAFELADDRALGAERLLRGLLLQPLYAIDCDRRLLEQLHYDLRFRWFTGLSLGAPVWSSAEHAAFRERLLAAVEGRQLLDDLLRSLRPIARTWPEQFRFDETIRDRWQQLRPAPRVQDLQTEQRHRQLLRAAGVPDGDGPPDGRLLRVLELILTRIGAPGLNGDRLAAEVGMSRRALFYLFDAHGLTPAAVIRNLRLEHCRQLLRDAHHSQRKIATIALDYGFGNASSFSRSFKQRYGVGPRQCRTHAAIETQAAWR